MCRGKFDEAFKNARKAIELDSLSPMFNGDLGNGLLISGRFDEAIVQAHKTLELDPNYAKAHVTLGWCFLSKGDTAGAIDEFKKGKLLDPDPMYDVYLGCSYVAAGDRAKAEQVLHDLEDMARQRYVSPELRVRLLLKLGEKDKALDWLDKML